MPKPGKIEQVRQLSEAIDQASNFFLVEFTGLSVAAMTALRDKVIEAGGRLRVVKNTLLRLALRELGIDGELERVLEGPTALLLCGEDPIGPAKAILDFAKDAAGQIRLKAGFVEGRVLSREEAESVAKLPSKLELQAQFLGLLTAPLSELVWLLSAAPAELTYVLQAKIDKEGGA
ncbi:MAG: 50S ribosomal protein L10 [Armatimonadetes bacterium]|nr:50S ribosomal protein L10 [Armatimonadota bacterium]